MKPDTNYPGDWPESLQKCYERLRQERTRVKVTYRGDYAEVGRFSRTAGFVKCPILVHNSRSTGGPAVGSRVIRVQSSQAKGPVYWDMERDEPILWVMSQ